MGRKTSHCICCYCGKVYKRTDETTSFTKCRTCMKKGNNTLLSLKQFNKRKGIWLQKLKGGKQKKK